MWPQASIHSGTTHRDATPAWPVQRDADPVVFDGAAFAYATDERTMLRAQRQRRAEVRSNPFPYPTHPRRLRRLC